MNGTPGFWFIVALLAVTIVAPSLIWLADRVADAYDALTARHAAQLEEDAATYGEPTREEVEDEWQAPPEIVALGEAVNRLTEQIRRETSGPLERFGRALQRMTKGPHDDRL